MTWLFTITFLITSLIIILATLIWKGIIKILPLMYQTAIHIEHLKLYRHMQEDIVAALKDMNISRVLDVAAGTGYLSLPLSRYYQVTALDANLDMLEYARKKSRKHKGDLRTVIGMAETLPLKEESFDAVVSSFALHHFSNITTSLMEMIRVLKQGGQLILMDIGGGSLLSDLHRVITDQIFRMLSRQNWPGYYYLDFDLLKQWLIKAGLEVKNTAVYTHPLPRRLIHLVKSKSDIKISSFAPYYKYGRGMSDEAKLMMFRAKALRLKTRKITGISYYLMLVKPFFEILAGNLYLGKRLLQHGFQHFIINFSERLINTVDTISRYTPALEEDTHAATNKTKRFITESGADICGIIDVEYLRGRIGPCANFFTRGLILGKNTLNLEDSGKDVWEVYAELTKICNRLSSFIRKEYGFTAESLFPFTLGIFYPEVARACGLGWKGLNNLLVTEKYGSKIRLGMVFTDMPLICDERWEKDLCDICPGHCIKACPAGAISSKGHDFEKCIRYFSAVQGCGLCVGVCCYPQASRPDP